MQTEISVSRSDAEAGALAFITVVLSIVLFLYFVISIIAFLKARKHRFYSVVDDADRFMDAVQLAVLILFVPLLISCIANLEYIEMMTTSEIAAATVISAMLLIFVTLEFSLIATLDDGNRPWIKLLTFALVCDVGAMVIISVMKSANADYLMVTVLLGLVAFFSSFLIIVFSHLSSQSYAQRNTD